MSEFSPTTRAELEESLDELVRRAHQNGVTVSDRGFELLDDDGAGPDWDLTIVRLQRQ